MHNIFKNIKEYPREEIGSSFVVTFLKAGGRETEAELSKGVNEGVNEGVNNLHVFIKNTPGKRAPYIASQLNVPLKTLERWIRKLKEEGVIEYRGSSKTGGYFIQDKMQPPHKKNPAKVKIDG